jgi:ribosomal protein S6--L-glutamate ligase
MKQKIINNKLLIGRDEWCALPELKLPAIKAKVDTGAKTSSLHAYNITTKQHNHQEYVYFDVHPIQGDNEYTIPSRAKIFDKRRIMSSNGHIELRYVIVTTLKISNYIWQMELTLSNRDPLRYRMLLGREALTGRALVDPSLSCNQSKLKLETLYDLYSGKGE